MKKRSQFVFTKTKLINFLNRVSDLLSTIKLTNGQAKISTLTFSE